MKTLTSNQKFGAINRRFDARAKLLKKLGWKYFRLEEYGIAVFTAPNVHDRKRGKTIPASVVQLATNEQWREILADKLRRGLPSCVTEYPGAKPKQTR
jgi:hypothetical protein